MKNITYVVSYTYNAGLLGTHKNFKTYDDAKAFATNYMENFKDCNKFYMISRLEVRKVFGITLSREVWHMEEKEEE